MRQKRGLLFSVPIPLLRMGQAWNTPLRDCTALVGANLLGNLRRYRGVVGRPQPSTRGAGGTAHSVRLVGEALTSTPLAKRYIRPLCTQVARACCSRTRLRHVSAPKESLTHMHKASATPGCLFTSCTVCAEHNKTTKRNRKLCRTEQNRTEQNRTEQNRKLTLTLHHAAPLSNYTVHCTRVRVTRTSSHRVVLCLIANWIAITTATVALLT